MRYEEPLMDVIIFIQSVITDSNGPIYEEEDDEEIDVFQESGKELE